MYTLSMYKITKLITIRDGISSILLVNRTASISGGGVLICHIEDIVQVQQVDEKLHKIITETKCTYPPL